MRASSSCIVLVSIAIILLWSIPCGFMLPSSLVASFTPVVASGTTVCNSCARNPVIVRAVAPPPFSISTSLIHLNSQGFNFLHSVVASQS